MVSMIIAADYNRPWNLGDGLTMPRQMPSSFVLVLRHHIQQILQPVDERGISIQSLVIRNGTNDHGHHHTEREAYHHFPGLAFGCFVLWNELRV